MRNPYKLPRKKKKEFKKRDPELYMITHAMSRMQECSIKVTRSLGGIIVNINSVGGSVGNGPQLMNLLNPGQVI